MSNELAVTQEAAIQKANFMPVMDANDVLARHAALSQFRSQVLKQDVDYGKIPGTSKDTLLKPGAEKLCTLFGLSASFEIVDRVEDWNGKQHDGEPFFYYLYRCTLSRGDMPIASSDGSCNSFEKKYRYRTANRKCPTCSAEAIIKGKAEFGGGWLCFKKKGGCGAKFSEGDASIEAQETGDIPNPDVADLVNTIQKMAQKRALVAAALLAVNASEFFTQDMEDFQQSEEEHHAAPVQTIELATPADVQKYESIRQAAVDFGFRINGNEPSHVDLNTPRERVLKGITVMQKWLDGNTPPSSSTAEGMGDDGSVPAKVLCDKEKYQKKFFAIAAGTGYTEDVVCASFIRDFTGGKTGSLGDYLADATTPEAQKLCTELQLRINADKQEFDDSDPFASEDEDSLPLGEMATAGANTAHA